MADNRTTAVVVHYARDELTDALVDDLLSVAAPSVSRIVVVDNGSPAPYTPRTNSPLAKVVRLPVGRGYGGAVQVAREHVLGAHFLLLNNDVRLPHDPVPPLVQRWRAGAALVGPRVEFPDGRFQLSWGDELGFREEFREKRRQREMRAGGGASVAARERDSAQARPVDWVSGVAALADVAAFDEVGGFDDRFFFYFEDVDLSRRLRSRGKSLWYEPRAKVVHELGATRESDSVAITERVATAHVLGHVYYYRRHRPAWELFALRSLLTAQVALSPSYGRAPWQRSLLTRIWKD